MSLATLLCPLLPKGHGEPRLQDSDIKSTWPGAGQASGPLCHQTEGLLVTSCASGWGSLQHSCCPVCGGPSGTVPICPHPPLTDLHI